MVASFGGLLMRVLLILLAFTVSVSAQTVRDKNGNVLYRLDKQGDRTIVKDVNGNPHGYYRPGSNGTTEFRDNNGNLISKETPR
jgi:hypothetical protein